MADYTLTFAGPARKEKVGTALAAVLPKVGTGTSPVPTEFDRAEFDHIKR